MAIYEAKLWYDTKTGWHYHFYHEDTEKLSDIRTFPGWVPEFAIPALEGASLRSRGYLTSRED